MLYLDNDSTGLGKPAFPFRISTPRGGMSKDTFPKTPQELAGGNGPKDSALRHVRRRPRSIDGWPPQARVFCVLTPSLSNRPNGGGAPRYRTWPSVLTV